MLALSLVLKYRTSTPPQIILIFESSFTLTLSFANEIIMRESKVTKSCIPFNRGKIRIVPFTRDKIKIVSFQRVK